jgi:uncharacterized protein YegL
MMYTQPASALKPAVIIYLIDSSDSMNETCGDTTKIARVNDALRASLKDMVRRSMRDGALQRRYKVAIISYNHAVTDLTNGLSDLGDILNQGIPEMKASGSTNTAGAFTHAQEILQRHLPELRQNPAPLICHLTDGMYSTDDPSPIIKHIQSLGVDDGTTLIENIFVSDTIFRKPVQDWLQWKGVARAGDLDNDYAKYLFKYSSPLPESYRQNINSYGYHLQAGAAMFFPGSHSDLIRLAFVVSAATQLR